MAPTDIVAFIVYVDDIYVTCINAHLITRLKDYLHQNFETNDLGPIQLTWAFCLIGTPLAYTCTRLNMRLAFYTNSTWIIVHPLTLLFSKECSYLKILPLPMLMLLSIGC